MSGLPAGAHATARPMQRTMSAMPFTIRPATPGDQDTCALARSERLNPNRLDWPHFFVAASERGIVGAVQLRRHPDGSRELGSLVVAQDHRRQGLAARLIDALLAQQAGAVQLIAGAGS